MLTFKVCKPLEVTSAPIPLKIKITWVIQGNTSHYFGATYFKELQNNE